MRQTGHMSPVQSGDDPRRQAVEAIEQALYDRGLRPGTAARRAGITPSWWSAVSKGTKTRGGRTEKANPSIDVLLAMARVVDNEAEVREILGLRPLSAGEVAGPRSNGSARGDQVTLARLEWEQQLADAYLAGLRAGQAARAKAEAGQERRPEAG